MCLLFYFPERRIRGDVYLGGLVVRVSLMFASHNVVKAMFSFIYSKKKELSSKNFMLTAESLLRTSTFICVHETYIILSTIFNIPFILLMSCE